MSKNTSAFTLIELLITVGIIAVLTGLILLVINPTKLKGQARDGVRKQDLALIKGAIEQYYAENNQYPASLSFAVEWVGYMKKVPNDPVSGFNYCYSRSDVNNYKLCAEVEDSSSANETSSCFATGSTGRAGFYCIENAL